MPFRLIAFWIVAILFMAPSHAQFEEPLVGPLIFTTPAEQDRIIIHDLGRISDEGDVPVRMLEFGAGELHVWDTSPDGCRVLFTLDEDREGLPTLYSADLNGGDVQAMVDYSELPPDQWGVWEPDWSSDGIIAFTMIRLYTNTRNGEIERETHIAYLADGAGIPDFYSVTGREYSPVWSHNGEWLAYVSYDERVAGAEALATAEPTATPAPDAPAPDLPTLSEADMWVVSADGETKYRLTAFSVGSVRHPRWSPDDELIGFVYSPSAANDTLWMTANSQGALATQLSYLWNLTLDHTWLPDSSAMLASVRDFRGESGNRLWRIPLVGNADENDANVFVNDSRFEYTDYPRFGPDGRYLAFRSQYAIIIYDTTTATWRQLNRDLPGNTPPVWSSAGFNGEANCG